MGACSTISSLGEAAGETALQRPGLPADPTATDEGGVTLHLDPATASLFASVVALVRDASPGHWSVEYHGGAAGGTFITGRILTREPSGEHQIVGCSRFGTGVQRAVDAQLIVSAVEFVRHLTAGLTDGD